MVDKSPVELANAMKAALHEGRVPTGNGHSINVDPETAECMLKDIKRVTQEGEPQEDLDL